MWETDQPARLDASKLLWASLQNVLHCKARSFDCFSLLQSFVAEVDPEAAGSGEDGDDTGKKSVDPVLQYPHNNVGGSSVHVTTCCESLMLSHSSRFVKGVSELEHMGFIKHTQRKKDHVQRLTWGAC